MAFDEKLAARVRQSLSHKRKVEEKKMFRGVTFMVNGKMCVNVSGNNLMCRFDPALHPTIITKKGVLPVIMKGREYKGFVYVEPSAIKTKKNFDFWINLCLDNNKKVKSSGRKK